MCDIQDIDVRHRTCDIVRHVRCRTSAYDIVCDTNDIVRFHLRISYAMSYVGNGRTMSYVMTYDIVGPYRIRHRMYVRCRMSTYYIVCRTSYVTHTTSYVFISAHILALLINSTEAGNLLRISYTMSYIGNGRTMSYVHDIRYRRSISYKTSYVRTMSYVNIQYRYIRHRMRYRIRHCIIKNLAVSP
jgi:hypothetical protein